MRNYDKANEALREILRDIQERGIWVHPGRMQDKETLGNDAFSTKELMNYSFCLIDINNLDKLANELKCNKEWCNKEFEERISNKDINPGEAWKLRKETWQEYLVRNNGKFAYSYNNRIRIQLTNVINELKKHINSRQAIISIFDGNKDSEKIGVDRLPCSLTYQFLFRQDVLHIIYNMRSCDYNLHFRNDIYLACKLLHYIAKELNVKVGHFFMNIGSIHIYKSQWDSTTF